MQELGPLIGAGVVFVLGVGVGGRILLLARKTGGGPELLLGAHILAIAAIAYPLLAVSGYGTGLASEVSTELLLASILWMAAAILCLTLFVQSVFRPDAALARVLVAAIALVVGICLEVAGYGVARATPSAGSIEMGWLVLIPSLSLGGLAYAWSGVESVLHYRKLRRRLALRLADPVASNRVLLWAVMSSAAAAAASVAIVALVYRRSPVGDPIAQIPLISIGAVALAAAFLAFLPPRAYGRLVERRTTGE